MNITNTLLDPVSAKHTLNNISLPDLQKIHDNISSELHARTDALNKIKREIKNNGWTLEEFAALVKADSMGPSPNKKKAKSPQRPKANQGDPVYRMIEGDKKIEWYGRGRLPKELTAAKRDGTLEQYRVNT